MNDVLLGHLESELADTVAKANQYAHLIASFPSDPNRAEWQRDASALVQKMNALRESIAGRQKDLESYK